MHFLWRCNTSILSHLFLLNRTQIGLYLPFSEDWFGTKIELSLVPNQSKSVITIQIWCDLTRIINVFLWSWLNYLIVLICFAKVSSFMEYTDRRLYTQRNLIKSNRNQIVFTNFRFHTIFWLIWNQMDSVRFISNQSENGEYNLISVSFNKISLCVCTLSNASGDTSHAYWSTESVNQ